MSAGACAGLCSRGAVFWSTHFWEWKAQCSSSVIATEEQSEVLLLLKIFSINTVFFFNDTPLEALDQLLTSNFVVTVAFYVLRFPLYGIA